MDESKHALVIGVDDYVGRIPRLANAVSDAEAVAEHLEQQHRYVVELLRDGEATAASIMDSLARYVAAGMSEESSFVIYYAGHGTAENEVGGTGPQGFLVPHGAHADKQDGWIAMESLRGTLGDLQCRHLMLVLDCCYAGAFQWTSTRAMGGVKRPLFKSQYERFRQSIAWHALTSASYDEKADDSTGFSTNRGDADQPGGHSPFALALIKALSSSAADSSRGDIAGDGVITATELHQYIQLKVEVHDRQTPGLFPLRKDNKGEYMFHVPGAELHLEPDPELNDENNPWLGNKAYSDDDHELYFGRETAKKDLLASVQANRFVVVVGASGTGKSSLVHAGLLCHLDASRWSVAEVVLTADEPVAQLEVARAQLAAAPAGTGQLLVIDQFEKLFANHDKTARAQFANILRMLIELQDGPTVLVALRSDFEPHVKAEFGDLWANAATYPVPEFSADNLQDIIAGPARSKAVFFEPAKIEDWLLLAVTGTPGAAALLSLTLADLYRQAQFRRNATGNADRMISEEDYRNVGGVVGVALRRASDLYDNADDPGKAIIMRVFLRLVDQKPDRLVGRNVHRDELQFGPEHEQLVNRTLDDFVAARLLTVGNKDGRGYVEPSHDALVSKWDKQLSWLAQSGSQEVIRDVSKVAREWSKETKTSKTSKHLWNQDPRLAELERRSQNDELNELEQDFEKASTSRKRRLAQIRRIAIAALMILTVAAVSAGIFAWVKRSEAIQEAERAASRALAADALNNVTTKTDLAALLALESVRVANTTDARGSLAGVLSLPTRFLQRTNLHQSEITAIAFSESGRIAATGDSSGMIRIWDVNEDPFESPQATSVGDAINTGAAIRDLFVVEDEEFSGVVAFDLEGTLRFFDFTGEGVEIEPPDKFSSAAVTSDGGLLAGVDTDGILRVYDIDEEFLFPERPTVDVEPGNVTDLAFSPDGTMLAWGDGTFFAVWSWADGRQPSRIDAGDTITAIAFSPDRDPNKAVVGVGVEQGTVFVVDRNDPNLHSIVSPAPVNQLFDLAFKPDFNEDAIDDDGTFTLASTHSNGDINLFDVVPGDGFEPLGFAMETMLGHTDEARKVAFAPDGRIASGAFSGEVIWWLDVPVSSLGFPWQIPLDPSPPMLDAAFVDPNRIVSLDSEFTAWLSDFDSFDGRPIVEELRVFSVDAAAGVIAVGLEDESVKILDQDGTMVRSLVADGTKFVALSSDGRRLATVSPWSPSFIGHLAIWDVAAGTLSNEQDLPEGFEPMSAFFADDGVVWIGGQDRNDLPTVLEVEATTGAVLGELQHSSRPGNGVTALAMSDDGRTLAAGAMDRRISLWDTDTLAARPGGEFTGHRGNVTGIVFWDGGDTLISSDDAGDVLMWDVSDRRQFARLGGPTDDVRSLEVDTEGATLVASSEEGAAWSWTLEPEVWRDRACELAGRNMTQAEWELYGDGGTRVRHCIGFPAEDGDVRDAEYDESLTD